MNQNLINIFVLIITCLFTVAWGVIFYQLKRTQEKSDKSENEIIELKAEIKRIKEKLWSDEKLTKVIENAVENSLLKWENKQLKQQQKILDKE